MEISIIIGTIVLILVVGCFIALLFSCIFISRDRPESLIVEKEIKNNLFIVNERKSIEIDKIEPSLVEI
jgi:CBS domain containing-hemolysin-like protein